MYNAFKTFQISHIDANIGLRWQLNAKSSIFVLSKKWIIYSHVKTEGNPIEIAFILPVAANEWNNADVYAKVAILIDDNDYLIIAEDID